MVPIEVLAAQIDPAPLSTVIHRIKRDPKIKAAIFAEGDYPLAKLAAVLVNDRGEEFKRLLADGSIRFGVLDQMNPSLPPSQFRRLSGMDPRESCDVI